MLASYRVHEMRVSRKLTPGLSVLRTQVFRSLSACKTFYHQTCAKNFSQLALLAMQHYCRGEVGGQRVTFGHVSNHPFPNRTGDFHRIRLSRPSVHLPWPDVPSGTAQVLYHLSSPEPLPLVSDITPII